MKISLDRNVLHEAIVELIRSFPPEEDEGNPTRLEAEQEADDFIAKLDKRSNDWNRTITSKAQAVRIGASLLSSTAAIIEMRDPFKLNKVLQSIHNPRAWLAILLQTSINLDYLNAKLMRRL